MKPKDIICILLILLVVFLIMRRCNKNGFGGSGVKDTTLVRVDTFWKETKTIDSFYVPKIINQITYIPRTDTFIEYQVEVLPSKTDTAKLIRDYFKVREYSDTQKIEYGRIIINDKVRANKITSRNLIVDQKIPEITKTVGIVEHEKKKRWGIGIQSGFGLADGIRPKAYIGIGVSYNLIRF